MVRQIGFEKNFIAEKLKGSHWKVFFRPLVYNYSLHKSITVPIGFLTDIASVPRFAWSIIPKDDTHTPACVLHDWMYYKNLFSRKACDRIFYEALKSLEVKAWKREVMFRAVRLGGFLGYNRRKRQIEKENNENTT